MPVDSFNSRPYPNGSPSGACREENEHAAWRQITVFDSGAVPNRSAMPERGIHTPEHLFAWLYARSFERNGVKLSTFRHRLPHRLLYEPDWYAGRAARR